MSTLLQDGHVVFSARWRALCMPVLVSCWWWGDDDKGSLERQSSRSFRAFAIAVPELPIQSLLTFHFSLTFDTHQNPPPKSVSQEPRPKGEQDLSVLSFHKLWEPTADHWQQLNAPQHPVFLILPHGAGGQWMLDRENRHALGGDFGEKNVRNEFKGRRWWKRGRLRVGRYCECEIPVFR